jgi:hypothetical protein
VEFTDIATMRKCLLGIRRRSEAFPSKSRHGTGSGEVLT